MARRFSSEGAAGLQGAGPDAAAAEGLAASVTINIGDSVSLASGREEGAYLYSMQTFKPKTFVRHPRTNPIHNFHAAVFEIYVQFEYRNQKRLQQIDEEIKKIEALDAKADDVLENLLKKENSLKESEAGGTSTPQTAAKLKDVTKKIEAQRQRVNELDKAKGRLEHERKGVFKATQQDHETNRREQERQTGKPLVYGDIIQLRHKFSDNFLSGSTVKTSKLEYNTLRVSLQEGSDRSCFFRVMPRYKVRGEGDEVKTGDQILLVSIKAPGHYLTQSQTRFSKTDGLDGLLNDGDFEVSLSAQETAWSIRLYTGKGSGVENSLYAGDVIQLFDREKDGYLSAARMIPVQRGKSGAPCKVTSGEIAKAVEMAFLNSGKDNDGGLRQESMSYWQVYIHGQHEAGAPLIYDGQQLVLRHLVTGMYLAVDPKSNVQTGRNDPPSYKAVLVESPEDPRAVFSVSTVDRAGPQIVNNTYCRLQNLVTRAFFHTSQSALTAVDIHTFVQSEAKGEIDDDVFDEKSNVNFRSRFSFEDAFEITRVPDDQLDDFNIVSGLVPLLSLVGEATSPAVSRTIPSQVALFPDRATASMRHRAAWQNLGRNLMKVGSQLLEFLTEWLLDIEEDDDSSEWGKAAYARQGLCQDLGVIDLIVEILRGPIAEHDQHRLTAGMFPELGSDEEADDLLWNHAMNALTSSAQGDETATDRYIARHFRVFLTHSMYLKTHGSAELLVELYTDNRDALDDILEVDERLDWVLQHLDHDSTSQSFIDHDFYNFLACLCVCDELAVQRAQSRIFNKLDSLNDDLFKHGHFVRLTPSADGVIMVNLGGKQAPIPIERMFQVVTGTGEAQDKGDGATSTNVALRYFEPNPAFEDAYAFVVSNIRLLASLCEGHGRDPVKLVQKATPKEALLEVVRHNGIPFDIRTSAADVLHEVFLDTAGALTVLSTRKGSKSVFLFDVDSGGKEPTTLDLPQYADLNELRAAYVRDLHSWLVDRSKAGFGAVIQSFLLEIRRLLVDRDEFEPYHEHHGAFIIQMLRSTHLAVEAGYYLDWAQLADLLRVLSESCLVFAEDVITTEAGTSREDETRDAIVAEVIEGCLKIFQLAHVHESSVCLKRFFQDWVRMKRAKTQSTGAGKGPRIPSVRGRGRRNGTLDDDPSAVLASRGLTAVNTVVALFDQDPQTAPDFNKCYHSSERGPAMSYLKSHFAATALSARCSLEKMLDRAYAHKVAVAKSSPGLRLSIVPRRMEHVLMDIVTRGQPEESEEYESNIVKEGMMLLEQMYSREVELFRAAVDIRLVNDATARDRAAMVEKLLPQLQYLVEDTQIDEKEAPEVTRLVDGLIECITLDGEPLFLFQDIAFKAGALEIVLKIFDQDLDDDDLQESDGPPNVVQQALAACLEYVQLQTRGHADAQERMFDEIFNLLNSENTRPSVVLASLSVALSEVFSTQDFQTRVRNAHIDAICKVMFEKLEDQIYVAELLDLLTATAKADDGGHAITRNGVLIISALMQRDDIVLSVLKKEAAKSAAQRRELKAILTAPSSDPLYRYHVSLVQLLSMLAESQNQFIESICKKVYSSEYLLDVLTTRDYYSRPATFRAYTLFLHHVYLSPNCVLPLQHPRPVDGDPRVWAVLDHIAVELLRLQKVGLTKETAEYLFYALIPFVSGFFKTHYNPANLDQRAAFGTVDDTVSQTSTGDVHATSVATLSAAEATARCESVVVDITKALALMVFSAGAARGSVFWTKSNRRKAVGLIVTLLHSTGLHQDKVSEVMRFFQEKSNLDGAALKNLGTAALDQKLASHAKAELKSAVTEGDFGFDNEVQTLAERKKSLKKSVKGSEDENFEGFEEVSSQPATKETSFGFDEMPKKTRPSVRVRGLTLSKTAPRDQVLLGSHEDENLTREFVRYTRVMWVMYSDQNKEEGHECQKEHHTEKGEMRNKDCFYLEVHDDGETILPCGSEFQNKIRLFTLNEKGEEHDAGFQTLLRYLGFLQETLIDVGSSDDDRETARENLVTTLNLLSAIMHRGICEEYKGAKHHDRTTDEFAALQAKMTLLQTKMALAGAVAPCIALVADDEDDVMKAAWLFFSLLLEGGNAHVQDLVYEAFQRQESSKSLVRIRDELGRGIAALLELQRTITAGEQAIEASNGLGSGLTLRPGDTLSGGSVAPEHIKAIRGHFDTVSSMSKLSIASSASGEDDDEEREEVDRARTHQKEELQWVLDIVRGIQLLSEGAHRNNQDWLREQGTRGQSVNFVVEICRALGLIYMNIGQGEKWQRLQWLELIDQLLDTITELCQGNQDNQLEALDEQIVKMINHIIAYDTSEEHILAELTDTKRAAITVLEAMLESNNTQARGIAKSVASQLNLNELYLAMNRFYYIDFYLKRRPAVVAEHDEHDPYSDKHLKAGHEIYYVLARIEDLTGTHYEWQKGKEDEIKKRLEGDDGGARSGGILSGLSKNARRFAGVEVEEQQTKSAAEKVLDEIAEQDSALAHRFEAFHKAYLEKLTEDPKIGNPTTKFAESLYGEFARDFLFELDRRGGPNIGGDADRYDFFKVKTRSIEFLRDDMLQKVYFEAPKTSLSKTVRWQLLLALNHASPQDKLRDFVAEFESLRTQLSYQRQLKAHFLTSLIAEGTGPYWRAAVLTVTYIINIILLSAYTAPTSPDDPEPEFPNWFIPWISFLGSVHVFLSLVICGEYLVNNWGFSPNTVYHVVFLLCSFLGLFYRAYFFAFHTLHIVQNNDILNRAIESITRNGISLLSVTFLAITVIYIFSVQAFLTFRADYDQEEGQYCNTLLECFITTITWGLTHGGGPREALSPGNRAGYFEDPHYIGRVVFDLAFWILIAVIIMNLVLGIIVDTFSQLRSEREANMEKIHNFCFICSHPAYLFDEATGGFDNHHRREHNMWDYVYYSEHVRSIPAHERNFHEMYLYRHLVDEPSTTPFPLKRALGVKTDTDDVGSKMDGLSDRLTQLERMLTARFEQADQAAVLKAQLELKEQFIKNAL